MTAALLLAATAVAGWGACRANRSCSRSGGNFAGNRAACWSAARTTTALTERHRRGAAEHHNGGSQHEQFHELRHSKNLQIQNSGRTPCPVPSSRLQPSTRRPAGRLLAPTAVQVPLFVVVKRDPGPLGVAPWIATSRRGDDDHGCAAGETIVITIRCRIDRRGIHGNRNGLTRNDGRSGNRLDRWLSRRNHWRQRLHDWRLWSRHGCKRIVHRRRRRLRHRGRIGRRWPRHRRKWIFLRCRGWRRLRGSGLSRFRRRRLRGERIFFLRSSETAKSGR